MQVMLSRFTVLATLAAASCVSAQSANFTLFGEANPEGRALPEERRAVAPISAPYFHEDSFITTDVRGWFAYHSFPEASVLGGGSGRDYAVELRLALTDRLQLVANKDGYLDIDSGLVKESGWNDVAAGLKYALIQDYKNDFHVAVGLGYQFAIGDPSVLQNDQEARGWVSVNKGFDKLHLGATLNYLKHTGNEDALGSSDRITYHLHADYWVNKWFSPVVEFNGYHSVNNGDNTPLPFSGADLANLGGGADLVTFAPGFEIRPTEDLGIRAAYETDLTTGDSIFGYRWTFSVVYHF
jgi:hypothetical protein